MTKFKLALLSLVGFALPAFFHSVAASEPFTIDDGLCLPRSYQANEVQWYKEVQWFKNYISGRSWNIPLVSFESNDA